MVIIDLATKTLQNAIKQVVDATKEKTDVIDINLAAMMNRGTVKSVQRGIFVLPAAPLATINISTVLPNKSSVSFSGATNANGGQPVLNSLTSTAITFSQTGIADTAFTAGYRISWEVVEYY